MNLSKKKCVGLSMLLASLLIFAGNARGQQQPSEVPQRPSTRAAKERFVGVWKLVSYEVGASHPMGRGAVGLLIYGADGHMSLQIMRPDRPNFRSDGSKEGGYEVGNAQETQSAFRGYIAYFGTYEVEGKERFVTHHIEGSLFPNWIGRDQIEFFELSDDQLTWGLDPIRYTWKRMK